ncbi:amino acid ABC transporter permease [Aestuariimicrobium kwangyangense]|uniref:amino acid ABC transporter permease n=1 Tax=Aestuariimicrobium kwangyangense TaxID=396389 RepID=UPI0003B4E2BD|nr:amino acid ABC transporter permease [Aestuariimicrobium kwangyangense]
MNDVAELFRQYNLVQAFGMTLLLTVLSAIGAALIGMVIAVLRISPVAALRFFGTSYVTLIRNTPLTLILFFCVFGFLLSMNWPLLGRGASTEWNNFAWAVVALSIYHASFVAEAIRSGVNTVPMGQAEAARALGLSFGGSIREVILPQALRGAVAPLGNTLIALTKNTTVAATVTVTEASTQMKNMIEFRPDLIVLIFAIIAFGFVVLTLPMGIIFTRLSQKLAVAR